MTRSARRLSWSVAAMIVAGLALAGGVAEAHATYIRSNPAADARLIRPPAEVRVSFSEPPDPAGSEVLVFTVDGRRVDRADLRATDAPNELAVSLAAIGDGGYTVAWTVLSTVDGHITRGSFVFAVGDAPLPAVPDVAQPVPPPGPLEIAGRALSFAGIVLAIGVGAFGLLMRPLFAGASRARERQLIIAAAVALVLGSALIVLAQLGSLPARFTLLIGLRAAAGLALLGALPRSVLRYPVLLVGGSAAALSAMLVSHAGASGSPVEMLLDLVHIAAVSIWAGGLAALVWSALPFAHVRDGIEAAQLGRAVFRFSLIALVAVATLALTGVLQSLRRLVLPQDLVETPYGIALLVKVVLVALAVGLGALNLLVWGPRLRRSLAPANARAGLVRGTAIETALLTAVLVATGALTALAPPAQASGAAFDQTRHVGGLRLQLLVPSTQPGRNRLVLRVHEGLRTVDAQRVALRFTLVEHDMGENELVAEQRAPGEYVAQGNVMPMFGTWRVETIVRLEGRDDVRTVFSVPIGTGEGAAARVLTAGPYTFIVFTDPSPVVAGERFALNVVVVDARGESLPGLTVLITPSGPAREDARATTEASTGRYVAEFDALDAGAWQLVISVPGASAAFPLDVTP